MMPVPSATGMNSPGGIRPCGRVLPAQQRLDALDPLAVQGDLGLVVQEQLVVGLQGAAQVAEHGEPGRGGDVLLGLEDDGAALELLGRVHGDVGVAQQVLGLGAVPRRERDADAGLDVEDDAVDVERAGAAPRAAARRPGGPRATPSTVGSRTANSSPPRRATVSPSRSTDCSRGPTWQSSLSP